MSDVEVRTNDARHAATGVIAHDEFASAKPKDRLDRTVDFFALVMPDMRMIGALMLLLVVYLAATGSDFGASQESLDALQEAQSAAAQAGVIAAF